MQSTHRATDWLLEKYLAKVLNPCTDSVHTINESTGTQKFFAIHFKFFGPLTLIGGRTNYQLTSTETFIFEERLLSHNSDGKIIIRM